MLLAKADTEKQIHQGIYTHIQSYFFIRAPLGLMSSIKPREVKQLAYVTQPPQKWQQVFPDVSFWSCTLARDVAFWISLLFILFTKKNPRSRLFTLRGKEEQNCVFSHFGPQISKLREFPVRQQLPLAKSGCKLSCCLGLCGHRTRLRQGHDRAETNPFGFVVSSASA